MGTVKLQVCGVCGGRTRSKAAMDEHIENFHGKTQPEAKWSKAKDQLEFVPCLARTRWGEDFT